MKLSKEEVRMIYKGALIHEGMVIREGAVIQKEDSIFIWNSYFSNFIILILNNLIIYSQGRQPCKKFGGE